MTIFRSSSTWRRLVRVEILLHAVFFILLVQSYNYFISASTATTINMHVSWKSKQIALCLFTFDNYINVSKVFKYTMWIYSLTANIFTIVWRIVIVMIERKNIFSFITHRNFTSSADWTQSKKIGRDEVLFNTCLFTKRCYIWNVRTSWY